jgi:predicted nucleic acid-binding Zn ribbon protein
MNRNAGSKVCINCRRAIQGRSDKKFCSDACRNARNNRLNSAANNYMRSVDTWIRRNRRIMQEILAGRKRCVVTTSTLSGRGFIFDVCTHTLKTDNKNIHFCYEYGYRRLDDTRVKLVRKILVIK